MRGVVDDHAPARPRPLVDIGHEDGGDGDIALELGEDVLRAGDPGDSTFDADLHIGQGEAQLPAVLEDGTPRLAHRLPAREETPARMDAAHVVGMAPHRIHGLEVLALDGAVEPRVGLLHLGVLLVGSQLGHVTTSDGPSTSTARASRAAPGQGPSTQMPVSFSKIAPWVEQMRWPPSSVMNSLGQRSSTVPAWGQRLT